jgi:hypothetical protein
MQACGEATACGEGAHEVVSAKGEGGNAKYDETGIGRRETRNSVA